jgi:acyl CoA:acetate/3-ketoacid CoA transferase alpha subunit
VNTYHIINVYSEHMSELFPGFKLPSSIVDGLVDQGVTMLVFVDPNRGRFSISMDDWIDYRVIDNVYDHIRQSRMDRG